MTWGAIVVLGLVPAAVRLLPWWSYRRGLRPDLLASGGAADGDRPGLSGAAVADLILQTRRRHRVAVAALVVLLTAASGALAITPSSGRLEHLGVAILCCVVAASLLLQSRGELDPVAARLLQAASAAPVCAALHAGATADGLPPSGPADLQRALGALDGLPGLPSGVGPLSAALVVLLLVGALIVLVRRLRPEERRPSLAGARLVDALEGASILLAPTLTLGATGVLGALAGVA